MISAFGANKGQGLRRFSRGPAELLGCESSKSSVHRTSKKLALNQSLSLTNRTFHLRLAVSFGARAPRGTEPSYFRRLIRAAARSAPLRAVYCRLSAHHVSEYPSAGKMRNHGPFHKVLFATALPRTERPRHKTHRIHPRNGGVQYRLIKHNEFRPHSQRGNYRAR